MSEEKQKYRCSGCGKYTSLIFFDEKEYEDPTYFSACCKKDYEIVDEAK